jgi:hypothetical protein
MMSAAPVMVQTIPAQRIKVGLFAAGVFMFENIQGGASLGKPRLRTYLVETS